MKYLSVASGIEAATVAWHPLGFEPVAFSEIDAFPCALLAHHYPAVPNWGSMENFKEWPDAAIDLLVGGTPCQDFSIAGLRAGISAPRGNLALVYLAIAARYRPQWLVFENVPGVRSSERGRDFGTFLALLGQLGYGWAYRSLDAQYFHLAQRRERVFVVGYLGGWRRAAAVLFESESLRWDSTPSRRAGKEIAGTVGASSSSGRSYGSNPIESNLISHPLLAKGDSSHDATLESYVTHALRAEGFDTSEDGTGGTPLIPIAFNARQDPDSWIDRAGPLDTDGTTQGIALIAFDTTQITSLKNRSDPQSGDPCHPLTSLWHPPAIAGFQHATEFLPQSSRVYSDAEAAPALQAAGKRMGNRAPQVQSAMQVRRLTPRECEVLQGFQPNYTLVPYRGKPAKDGPRYKAIGNSFPVPVLNWIGKRIQRFT